MNQSGFKQEQIEKLVRGWLFTGEYQVGDTLPGDKTLAKALGVNHLTVAKGLRPLIEEGFLERIPRRGTLVKKDLLPTRTNNVGVIVHSQDDFYSQIVSRLNHLLEEEGLFPTLINEHLVENTDAIIRFLNRMIGETRPYGYLAFGDMNFPYDIFRNQPNKFQNIVFLLRYQAENIIPNAKTVLIDYKDLGRQVVKYFAERGLKKILFPAMSERLCKGPWASLQYQVFQGILEEAGTCGVFVDELLFWRMFNADREHYREPLSMTVRGLEEKVGIFCWSDVFLIQQIKPMMMEIGFDFEKNAIPLGNFNTHHAKENHIPSFDLRIDDICRIGVDMLAGNTDQENVLLKAKLVEWK